jgi:hypothetical protein
VEVLTFLAPTLPTPPSGTPAQIAQIAINFFALWIARVGGIVAFVGAVKFALGVKSDEAGEKVQGLLTMVSGFMIVSAVTSLNIFTATGGAGINAEFLSIMGFIRRWTSVLGGAVTFVGGVMFALSIKEENATAKVTAMKTFAAGAIVMAASQVLHLFVS